MLPVVPRFDRYVEPFAGSACLFFRLEPEVARLSDLNSALIDFYRVVSRTPWKLHDAISAIPRDRDHYLSLRSSSPTSQLERACRFGYLNRNCFNAVYRTNRHGEFNVPFGTRTGALPSRAEFAASARLLRRAELLNADFRAAVEGVGRGDFVYLDPPYVSTSRQTFGEYGYGSFGANDVADFVDVVRDLDSRGCKILVSFGDSSVIPGGHRFRTKTLAARRTVAGSVAKRVRSAEVLAWNYRV
jgi:DNA adenine methylase